MLDFGCVGKKDNHTWIGGSEFLAPEIKVDAKPYIDWQPSADIYALGALLYCLIFGTYGKNLN